MESVLADRRAQSAAGLNDVRSRLAQRLKRIDTSQVAVYVTGSFGRLEARYPKGSDLDLFFLYAPGSDDPKGKLELPRLEWFRLIAAVIDVAEALEFEPFSKDGEYLKAHNVRRIGQQLGSRHEDAENVFTARILLLLESQFVVNEDLYDDLLLETIGFYFGDYATTSTTLPTPPDASSSRDWTLSPGSCTVLSRSGRRRWCGPSPAFYGTHCAHSTTVDFVRSDASR